MGSPHAFTRSNRPQQSKLNRHHRSGQISRAAGLNHVNTDKSWRILPPLSAPDGNKWNANLIQGWLHDVEEQKPGTRRADANGICHAKRSNSRHRARPHPNPVQLSPEPSWALHGLLPLADAANTAVQARWSPKRKEHKRSRTTLQDSSIVALDSDQGPSSAAEGDYYERGNKRRRPGSDDVLASHAPSSASYQFEKRPRHKTRSDRYDVARINEGRPRKREEKTRDGKYVRTQKNSRNAVTSAKEVMDNFNSKSILTEHMTMQPPLKAGLFDNGRTSRKQVTDLTFHDMAFLKQPRREPQKKVLTRRRESERKRDEREREEISAFFLERNLPDRYGAQVRKQPRVSDLSGLDGRTGDSSTPNYGNDGHVARLRDQQYGDKGRSRQSTCITWLTNRESPDLDYSLKDGLRKDLKRRAIAHDRSSSPVHIREALARSGIFDNTGIPYLPISRRESEGPGVIFNDDASGTKSLTVDDPAAHASRTAPREPVRIIRYQDRGTMADEEARCPESHARYIESSSARERSTEDKGGSPYAVEPDATDVAASSKPAVSAAAAGQAKETGVRGFLDNLNTAGNFTSPDKPSDDLRTGSERPKSTKWAVIQQLEAGAEDVRYRHSPSAAMPMARLLQQHTLPIDHHNLHGIVPPKPLRLPAPHGTGSMIDVRHLAAGAVPLPRQEHVALSALSTRSASWYPAVISTNYPLISNPSTRDTRGDSFVRSCVAQSMNDPPLAYQPLPMGPIVDSTKDSLGQQSQRQRMQDYIAQIEQEVLDRPQSYDRSRQSAVPNRDHGLGPDPTGLGGDDEANSAYQTYDEMNGTLLTRPPSSLSRYDRTHVQKLDEDEEQRFMSSFWRPKQYHI